MIRLLLLLVLWEARAAAARPRFPRQQLFRLEDWRRVNAGALRANGKSSFACCVASRRKVYRGHWACRCTDWRAGASARYRGSTLREREGDAVSKELAAAMKRIGELTMENEVLRARVGHVGPLARRRSR